MDQMSEMTTTTQKTLNGLDPAALEQAVGAIAADPSLAPVAFRAKTSWQGSVRSRTEIHSYDLAGAEIPRRHVITSDEPSELLGTNTAPNPQDLLLAAVNACMMVGFVVGATARGIRIDSLEIESTIELDLRGAFGIDRDIAPGTKQLRYTVRVRGNATRKQFEELHAEVMSTSPNRYHLSQPIPLVPNLIVE